MNKRRPSAKQREKLRANARGCCEYCLSQEQFSPDTFSVEHVIPWDKGGSNIAKNLALACQGCNNRKFVATQAIDPVSGELASLYHPRRDHWSRHFAWNEDYTLVVGLTPTGRASVVKLALNRPALVNLRRILVKLQLHPPATKPE
jgi:hypothetical protein